MKRHQNGKDFGNRLPGDLRTFMYTNCSGSTPVRSEKDLGCPLEAARTRLIGGNMSDGTRVGGNRSDSNLNPTGTAVTVLSSSTSDSSSSSSSSRNNKQCKRRRVDILTDDSFTITANPTAFNSGAVVGGNGGGIRVGDDSAVSDSHTYSYSYCCRTCSRVFDAESRCRAHVYQVHLLPTAGKKKKQEKGVDKTCFSIDAAPIEDGKNERHVHVCELCERTFCDAVAFEAHNRSRHNSAGVKGEVHVLLKPVWSAARRSKEASATKGDAEEEKKEITEEGRTGNAAGSKTSRGEGQGEEGKEEERKGEEQREGGEEGRGESIGGGLIAHGLHEHQATPIPPTTTVDAMRQSSPQLCLQSCAQCGAPLDDIYPDKPHPWSPLLVAAAMKRHLNSLLPQETKFYLPCEQCDKQFADSRALMQHVLYKHAGEGGAAGT